ncbi:MAG: HlyD family efflux transporter periplasmic adaptor subunit [Chitinophagales bacterium]|nr:HlyD family efflux transporter periplasmic adaptor subunit [Chitinophagales bacterium]
MIHYKSNIAVYLTVISFIILLFVSLFLIDINITIVSSGLVRPRQEKSEVRIVVGGILDSVGVNEYDSIQKGAFIALIRDDSYLQKKADYVSQIKFHQEVMSDVTRMRDYLSLLPEEIKTPNYRQQFIRFLYQLDELNASIKKTHKELEDNKLLYRDRVISSKELFDKEIEYERLVAGLEAFKKNQFAVWQGDYVQHKLDKEKLQAQMNQLNLERNRFYVYSPISGVVQNIQSRYPGTYIAAGETLCTISPETTLIGECFVNTRDVGLLKIGQQTKFQIDAFDYNFFGILTGKIISIDNDFTIVENKPVFKVRCSFDTTQLHLKNGYKGELKKGLSFQARFIVAERTLWQLLFDKIDDWLNPTAPMPQQLTQRHE